MANKVVFYLGFTIVCGAFLLSLYVALASPPVEYGVSGMNGSSASYYSWGGPILPFYVSLIILLIGFVTAIIGTQIPSGIRQEDSYRVESGV